MRDIKFRAWDVKNKGFVAGFNMINYHSYFNHGLRPSIYRYDKTWEDGDYILEQYTGLNDKNGREIYEGDICEIEFPDKTKDRLFVIWSEKIAGFHFSDGCGGFWRVTATPLEIIGNIQENPGLLNE